MNLAIEKQMDKVNIASMKLAEEVRTLKTMIDGERIVEIVNMIMNIEIAKKELDKINDDTKDKAVLLELVTKKLNESETRLESI